MALFRKLQSGKLGRAFDPSNKTKKVTTDRVIEDMEEFKILVTQTANRIEAIRQTAIPQDLKDKFIAAEEAKLGYNLINITSPK
jgi:hypothetical protein